MFSVDTKLMIVDAIFCCESAQRATDAVIEVLYRKANEFFQAEYLEDSDIDKLLQKFQQVCYRVVNRHSGDVALPHLDF